MEPQPTAVQAPIHLRIADDLRMQIERRELTPGDSLPTLAALCEEYDCSMSSARGAISLLKAQGLITTGRGKAPVVRGTPRRVVRSSDRHQAEKDLALGPESARAAVGEAETNLAMSITEQEFSSSYDIVQAGPDIAEPLHVKVGEQVLRRRYTSKDVKTGRLLSSSTSHIPLTLISSNPALLDESNEPWPGGTMHQFSTVGIEVMKVVDEVTARMPSTVEMQQWGLPEGVPLIFCRRISLDEGGNVVEISDADYPADRTELRFITPLNPWPKKSK
ncbi:GntR family transcriptional regulator [Streptomyces buecherae]|uniref:GntR family transcriptional regulator n=1 Tax=Streptomyces buecherae TaxID=2763006 RepID=A0A7H8N924_9ACTN|nr:GntR family transcriptional regulator [Streptomyces buecherae]QKW50960.1 GntR family transcriptional regulator [Streptomyces buecherae]